MTTVVLIHGSTQNASCWDRVRPLLDLEGHRSVAVGLPGDRPDHSATDLARIIVEQMTGVPDDCVVVGHSASGILLPRIAEMRPVAALVFLAAMIPKPGMSAMEQYEEDPAMLNAAWVAAGPRWSDPANWRALADEFLFHDVLLSNREWAYSTLRPMRIEGALREPLAPSTAIPDLSMCVVAGSDRTIDPEWQRKTWQELDLVTIVNVNAGHCPHVSSPRETAGAILYMCEASRHVGTTDYDTFAQLQRQEQLRVFNAITPKNRAEIVKTQVSRWRDMNRSRLTNEQIALLDEMVAALVPSIYGRPRDRAATDRLRQLEQRMFTLFTREEIWQATVGGAPYIPPAGT